MKTEKDSNFITTIFDDDREVQKISQKNIVQEGNFINVESIKDKEFDELGKLRKVITFSTRKDFIPNSFKYK